MSASTKRGRPPRHPIDVLRTKIWFASLKKISKLPSAYAIEMAVCAAHQAGKSDGSPRPRKFAAYANGQRVPQRKGDAPGIVDLAEARFPGSAAAFYSPIWHLLASQSVDREWIYNALRNLSWVSFALVPGGVVIHPRDFYEGLAGMLSDLPPCIHTLAAALLYWRLAEAIADAELRHQAIDSYLMLQPELEALPELANNLASELFEAIDTKFPHWVHSQAERLEFVVFTNELRASRPGQALTRKDVEIRARQLRWE